MGLDVIEDVTQDDGSQPDTSPDVSQDAAEEISGTDTRADTAAGEVDVAQDVAQDTSSADVSSDTTQDTTSDVSMDGITDDGSMTDADAATATDAPVPEAPSDVAASGACMNESDLTQHNTQDIPEAVITTAKDCYLAGDNEDDDDSACTMALINDPQGINLTPECTDCHTASAVCAKAFCDIECLGPNVDEYAACRELNGCTPIFYECSGLPQAE